MDRAGRVGGYALVGILLAVAFSFYGDWLKVVSGVRSGKHLYQSLGTDTAWDVRYHLGGYGPYVERKSGIITNQTLPPGCRVDQVHMIARHAERYPTVMAGSHMQQLLGRIKAADVTLNGSLAFVNDWTFFTQTPEADFEQLTRTGSFAGSATASQLGLDLRSAYHELIDLALDHGSRIYVWASVSQRVIDTAKLFMDGFVGRYREIRYNEISETEDRGADTLTPGDTCLKYANDADEFGWASGSKKLEEFMPVYLEPIRARFNDENPGLAFTIEEIYVMQEMCGFELQARGKSKWCDAFTYEDWLGFEYARDVLHFYRSGNGNPYAATMGWLWLNATNHLLQGDSGRMFMSFVHDGDIIPVLAALELFQQHTPLPLDRIMHERSFRISETVPMGARMIFERLSCWNERECWSNELYPNHVYCTPDVFDYFVRIKINGGVVPMPGCTTGPGASCPLEQFHQFVVQRGEETGNFATICGLTDDVPHHLTFMDV